MNLLINAPERDRCNAVTFAGTITLVTHDTKDPKDRDGNVK